ncbi:hypothetical protein PPROV_001082400 [Pycnococcus provasolii]|uniref:Glycosyltransferase 2-like domain-containing protein n=1 Tax=Pycnococcus provasolii TaxID=41880 RepID=A0A830I4S0_9CHLO|nr:hypothetical protein PPROV_001082400 [Pycnococcus provasolii]
MAPHQKSSKSSISSASYVDLDRADDLADSQDAKIHHARYGVFCRSLWIRLLVIPFRLMVVLVLIMIIGFLIAVSRSFGEFTANHSDLPGVSDLPIPTKVMQATRETAVRWREEAQAWKSFAQKRAYRQKVMREEDHDLARAAATAEAAASLKPKDAAAAQPVQALASNPKEALLRGHQQQTAQSSASSLGDDPMPAPGSIKTMSVVLPCAGEDELMAMTAKSFVDFTPEDVLEEVVIVDDGSNPPLETFWPKGDFRGTDAQTWAKVREKVRFLRHDRTIGLMNARTTGANAAKGDSIAVFDCHVKPDPAWSKHLLNELNVNPKRVTIPTITSLDVVTWQEMMHMRPRPGQGMASCYFAWDSEFKWFNDRFHDATTPRWVPMMSGGLFAMTKWWWKQLGGYDSAMTGWGGENIDQSLRIWLCGGEITHAEPAYIAHMWRTNDPKTKAHYHINGDVHRNRWRAVHGWLGAFENVTLQYPDFARFQGPTGQNEDMHEYNEVRQRLKCKTFDYYLDFFHDIYEEARVLPDEIFRLESVVAPGKCLDRSDSRPVQWMMGHAKMADGPAELKSCNTDTLSTQWWHMANRDDDGKCCKGLRGYLSDQCLGTKGSSDFRTSVCTIDGSDFSQKAKIKKVEGSVLGEVEVTLQNSNQCLTVQGDKIKVGSCGTPESRWRQTGTHLAMEREVYNALKAKQ